MVGEKFISFEFTNASYFYYILSYFLIFLISLWICGLNRRAFKKREKSKAGKDF